MSKATDIVVIALAIIGAYIITTAFMPITIGDIVYAFPEKLVSRAGLFSIGTLAIGGAILVIRTQHRLTSR